jgi:Domain of unknown function (DUF4252)
VVDFEPFSACTGTRLGVSGHNFSWVLASYPPGVDKAAMFRQRASLALLGILLAAPLAVFGESPRPVPEQLPSLNWVPQGFEVLGQRAAFHTDFTFDRSMLQLAGYFVGDADQQTRNAIAKLNGISVHSYHFSAPGQYDPAALDRIRKQCEALGWKHLVTAHAKGDPFNQGQTDLWINVQHMDVTGMMVLFSGSKDLNLIALNGDISTLDLLHLRGHFGIPRFPGDHFEPGPSERARPPYVSPAPDQTPPGQYPGTAPEPESQGVGIGGAEPTVEAAPPPPIPPGL